MKLLLMQCFSEKACATPTALILSRQNIKDLPGSDYKKALQAKRGAYIVQKDSGKIDVVLLASGSEVATLVEGADN